MAPQFRRPLPGAPITSGFGMRNGVLHAGIDIAAAPGTPIGAAAAGIITRAGWFDGYGNCVDVDHGGGYMTRYGHMLKVLVRVSQQVTQGATLGLEGMTGDATGPHLHFEIRINGNPVNPIPYLDGTIAATNTGGFTAENVGIVSGTKDAVTELNNISRVITDARFWVDMGYIIGGFLLVIIALLAMGAGAALGAGKKLLGIGTVAKAVKAVSQ